MKINEWLWSGGLWICKSASETSTTLWSRNDFIRLLLGVGIPFKTATAGSNWPCFEEFKCSAYSMRDSIDAVMSGFCIQLSKVFLWKQSALVFAQTNNNVRPCPSRLNHNLSLRVDLIEAHSFCSSPRAGFWNILSIVSALYSKPNSRKLLCTFPSSRWYYDERRRHKMVSQKPYGSNLTSKFISARPVGNTLNQHGLAFVAHVNFPIAPRLAPAPVPDVGFIFETNELRCKFSFERFMLPCKSLFAFEYSILFTLELSIEFPTKWMRSGGGWAKYLPLFESDKVFLDSLV